MSKLLRKAFYAAVLLAFFTPDFSRAANGRWIRSGPEGGSIAVLAMDPANPQIVYAGSAHGGIFKSTDGGNSWNPINEGLTASEIDGLAVDPTQNETVYACGKGGIFKSTNGGISWNILSPGFGYLTNIRSIAIDPLTPSTIYAGTYSGGLFKSTDGGVNWSTTGLTNDSVFPLAIDPAAPQTIYAGTDSGVSKSTDGGSNWSTLQITTGFPSPDVISIDPLESQIIYIGTTFDGIFKSTDGGNQWSAINTGLPGAPVISLAINPTVPQILYAGTNGEGLYKSTDAGSTWVAIGSNLFYYSEPASALLIDPTDSDTLYAGTLRGVFKSTNAGGGWNLSNRGLIVSTVTSLAIDPSSPQILYAGTYGSGIYKSINAGNNWIYSSTNLDADYINALAINPAVPETLYAGTSDYANAIWGATIYKSTNGADSWNLSLSTLTPITSLAIDPAQPDVIYAGTLGNGAYIPCWGVRVSNDGGNYWGASGSTFPPCTYALAIDPVTPTTVYAAGALNTGGAVFKKTFSSTFLPSGVFASVAYALAIDPTDTQIIYAGTSSGMFKSTNAATAWTVINTGLTTLSVRALAIDPTDQQIVYAGTYGGGVFKSTDAGNNWIAFNAGMTAPNVNIYALAIDPMDHQTIYAGTNNGVWIYSASAASNITINAISPTTQTAGGASFTLTVNGSGFLSDAAVLWNGSWLTTTFASSTQLTATVPASLIASSSTAAISVASGGLNSNSISFIINPAASVAVLIGINPAGLGFMVDGTAYWASQSFSWTPGSIHTIATFTPQGSGGTRYVFANWSDGGAISHTITGPASAATYTASFAAEYLLTSSVSPQNCGTVSASPTSVDGYYASGAYVLLTATPNSGYLFSNWSGDLTGSANPASVTMSAPRSVSAAFLSEGTVLSLSLSSGGAASYKTAGTAGTTRVGYAAVDVNSGAVPYATAVFSFRKNGITVTEAGVPASPPTTQARVFIEYRAHVLALPGQSNSGFVDINTGIAVVNTGADEANVTYTLRDTAGNTVAFGNGTIAAGAHFAKFVNQLSDVAPNFSLPANFLDTIQFGTLEIEGDQLLSVLALRGTNNQQNDFLITTTPVADLAKSLSYDPIYFPQFADGGGYTTSLVLLNTSSQTEIGTLQIRRSDGSWMDVRMVGSTPGSLYQYTIPAGHALHFQTDGSPPNVNVGWVRLTPIFGSPTPICSGVFSYNPGPMLISESGIPSVTATMHARVYVDLSGNHNTGLAIANVNNSGAIVTINAYHKNGVTPAGTSRGPLQLLGNGHDAEFADQLISGLPAGFTGVLDITCASPFAALTIRSLVNERNDFLMTTFPVADANQPAPSPIVFPQIADGGGYTTEFILLSPQGASNATLGLYDENGDPAPF